MVIILQPLKFQIDFCLLNVKQTISCGTYSYMYVLISGDTLCRDNCQLIGMPFLAVQNSSIGDLVTD